MYDWFKEIEPEIQKRMTVKLDSDYMLELLTRGPVNNDSAFLVHAFEDIDEEENASFKQFKEAFNQLFDTLQKSGVYNDKSWIWIWVSW